MKKNRKLNRGAVLLLGLFSLLFLVLGIRFVTIQITGEAYGYALAAKAQQKYTKESVIEAKRGTIYDRNGEVIAEDVTSYKLIAILDEKMTTDEKNPQHVVDKEKTAHALAKYIDLSESEIYKILSKEDKFQVEFGAAGRDISLQKKQEIEKLKLPGITFVQYSKRYYPNGIFSSHLVGFVDMKDGSPVGQLGIELQLNDILSGEDGKIIYETDKWGYILPSSKQKIIPAKNGKDVYLTIDKKIQTFLEDALTHVEKKYKPTKMVAVVADPHTGEILGMGQRPTFDPNTKKGIEKTWYNEVIESSYEPGSTMKIFTLSAALEEDVLNLNETFRSGSFQATRNSRVIRDHNYYGWGQITFLEGVQRSSNVAFATIVKDKLGFDTFREYLTKFGFDRPTNIDLPNETGGKIVYQYPDDKITTGYGQGTAITPIQQVQAATAIAGNGEMVKPQVIKKIIDSESGETVQEAKREVTGKPISKETAKQVREILETVITSPKGTGYNRYNIDGYDVAGKTGTANITEGGKYLRGANDYIYSFLGMAPKDNPELVVYVAVKQPKVNYGEGWKPVSYIFKRVMKNSLQYLNIQPSEVKKLKDIKIPTVINETVEEGKKTLENLGADVIVLGKGKRITAQLPNENESILEGERVILLTDGDHFMPNLKGWSLRDVMKVVNLTDIELKTTGSGGYVVKQSLKEGTKIKSGDQLTIQLQPPDQKKKSNIKKDQS